MMTPTENLNSHQWNTPIITPTRLPALYVPQERSPLIRKANSFNIPITKKGYGSIEVKKKSEIWTSPPRKILSLEPIQKIQEIVSLKRHPVGRSTFGQTVSAKGASRNWLLKVFKFKLFNSIATLLGVGMLAEPLAFSYTGWGCGTLLLVFYGFLTCYTQVFPSGGQVLVDRAEYSAKILARFIIADPAVRTYADIGRKAFGKKSMNFISLLFCLELFTIAVALVTLYGDSLGEFLSSTPSNAQLTGSTETVAPAYPANFYKILGLIVFVALAVIINVWG